MQEGSLFSTPSPAFTVCRFFDDGNSDWCEVILPRSFFLNLKKIIYLFIIIIIIIILAALGLHCCARAFSSCSERGLFFVAVCRLLTAVASLVVEHGL